MPDWSKSMQQIFEYYVVNPNTWRDDRKLEKVTSCSITWDEEAETIASASFDLDDEIGEEYIRVYLVTIQNGVKERFPLGTFLVQTPSQTYDGRSTQNSLDAYSPLTELKEKYPAIGYFIKKYSNVMDSAYDLVRGKARAPIIKTTCDEKLTIDFVADPGDNILKYSSDLISNAKYKYGLDEMGRILFAPKQETASLQSVKTFNTGNSSILYPDVSIAKDLYGIPNVVEVLCSNGTNIFHHIEKNEDPSSPTSIKARGREIVYREADPSIVGTATQERIEEYAKQLLKELSTVEYTIDFSHAYCQVRVGDCVRLEYPEAGLNGVKAKIISQSISCKPGCPVSATAVYTKKYWN